MDARRPHLITYLDSSALGRIIFAEGDLSVVRQALADGPVSSELTIVEIRSAIWKRWRDGQMDENVRDELLSAADALLFTTISMVSMSARVFAEASGMVARFPIRTLDALHLATAVIALPQARRHGRVLRFCTADKRQIAAAREVFGVDHVLLVPPLP